MSTKPTVSELETAARRLLPLWGLHEARLEFLSQSENTVFKAVASTGECFVLRVHRPGYHTLPELESEHLWTRALNEAGISAPRPRKTLDGCGYAEMTLACGGHKFTVGLSEWVEGETLRALAGDDDSTQSHCDNMRAVGKLLGRLHNQVEGWQAPVEFTRHALDADGLMGERPFWGPFWAASELGNARRATLRRLRRQMHAALSTLDRGPDVFGLIHADLHPGNVLDNGRELHIIDFDDAGFGWHAYDLAIPLLPYDHRNDFARISDALVAGYRTQRRLGKSVLERLPMFRCIRRLAQIGWDADRPELDKPERIPRLADEAIGLARTLTLTD
ncbi:MAG: phosphotransferase [Pseudomonadota bacterium]